MDMISNTSSSSNAPVSSPHNHHHRVMVPSPIIKEEKESRNTKQTRATLQTRGSGERKPRPHLVEALKCPRCDSTDTKFCYYNNYRTTQPRYFCKTCRRYWTHGGTLRNVPIGGRCRKNKHVIESSSGSSSSLPATSTPLFPGINISSNKISINTQMMMVPNMKMPASETMGLFPNVLPTVMPTSSGFDLTMNNQQVALPFLPLSLSNQAPVLATRRSGTTPSFLDILRRGILHASSSNNYGGGLTMSGNNNGMDVPFLLPSFGAMHGHGLSGSTTDDVNKLVGDRHGVNIGDNNFVGSTGVQKQEDEYKVEEDNKSMEINNNNNDGSLLCRYWTYPNINNNEDDDDNNNDDDNGDDHNDDDDNNNNNDSKEHHG